jgi:hypothetical protein
MPMIFENVCSFNGTYSETAAAGHSDIIIRANNPFDPYLVAGGEEIAGLDELNAIFANCRVLASDIVLTVQNLDADKGITAILLPSLLSSTLSNASGSIIQPYAKSVGVQNPVEKTFRHEMSSRMMAGKKPRDPLDDDWVCLSGSAPTKEWFWHVIFNGDIGVTALNIRYSLTMHYLCEWYGLAYLSQT